MSEARPGLPPIEKPGGKLVGKQRASSTRKPNAVRLVIKTISLAQPSNLIELVNEQLPMDMACLRFNIKFIVNKRGSNVFQFCKELHRVGIKVSRGGIVRGGRKRSVHLLYLTTMALALRVPTWVMIHPNIESIWDSLDLD